MRFIFFGSLFFVICVEVAWSQSVTVTYPGDWNDPSIWLVGDIGDHLSEQVGFIGTSDAVTISNGDAYTIGALSLGSNTIKIKGSLEIGSAATQGSLLSVNDATIIVNGSLTIWGPLTLGDRTKLIVNGSLVVKGLFNMGASGMISVSASGYISFSTVNCGSFTTFENHGIISVKWSIVMLNPLSVTNTGHITANSCLSTPGICPILLPVELLFFNGVAEGDHTRLHWATASEKDFDKFIVEQSLDGIHFNPIGEVPGAGNSVVKNDYQFDDKWPPPGLSFYRLAMVDLDGALDYSEVLAIKSTVTTAARIYPNPVSSSRLHIDLNFVPEKPTTVILRNQIGNRTLQFRITDRTNILELPNLDPGVYFLSLTSGKFHEHVRLIIQ